MIKKTNSGLKIICINRKASFNYFFEDLLEAGIVLKGSEIKSIRDGKINIADSYAVEKNGELILINSHISAYKQASYSNHNPTDERKLLLNKKEINKLDISTMLASEIEQILTPCEKNLYEDISSNPHVLFLAGVNGSGKTTTAGKIAEQFRLQNKSVI